VRKKGTFAIFLLLPISIKGDDDDGDDDRRGLDKSDMNTFTMSLPVHISVSIRRFRQHRRISTDCYSFCSETWTLNFTTT
jgi:hypothetical protein